MRSKFSNCFSYLTFCGIFTFILGRLLPKSIFHHDKAPFKSFSFEKGGALYNKLGIKSWMNKLPDMSRILPFLVPPKWLCGNLESHLPLMLSETCIAEFVHILACIFSLRCLSIWQGLGGICVTLLFILLNIPFIIIQRYNRPRLRKLYIKLKSHISPTTVHE